MDDGDLGNSNDANQPQVLHTSKGKFTDNTCLMAGVLPEDDVWDALRLLLPELRDEHIDYLRDLVATSDDGNVDYR